MIIENKKLVNILKESLRRSFFIFNNLPDLVYIFEIDSSGIPTKLIDINDEFCKLLKYKKEEALELSATEIFSMKTLENIDEVIGKMLKEKSIETDLEILDKFSNEIIVHVKSNIVEYEGHNLVLNIGRKR